MSGDTRAKDNKSSLSHRAQQKFNVGKYVEAVDALEKLIEEIDPKQDIKVRHNVALARYTAGLDSVEKLQIGLRTNLRAFLQEHEKVKDTNSAGGESKNGEDANVAAVASASSSTSFSVEQEAAFLRYNYAASLFLSKQYALASSVLETMMRNIDPIDEFVAMHACFLYLDVVLHSSRGCVTSERERLSTVKKAQAVITYLEKPHRFNVVQESPDHLTQHDAGGNVVETEQQRKNRWDVTEFRFRLHLYKAKFMLLQGNLKTAKKEVKSALEIFQKEIKSRERTEDGTGNNTTSGSITTTSLALESEKTATTIGHPCLAVQNSTGLFLKANLEYLRKNYKKCIKLLASCTQEAVSESVFLNNMGCIHFQMGQRKAAQSYFSRALQATTKSNKTDPIVLVSSSHHEIMYNNGLHLLLQGEYSLAFRCFHESSRLFFNRPKLWLRMGECCTAAFAQQQKVAAAAGNKSGLIQGIVGSGSHRRVLMPTSVPSAESKDIDVADKSGKTNGSASTPEAAPKMNLPFAAKCFKNVVLLCNQLLEAPKSSGSIASSFGAGVLPRSGAEAEIQDFDNLSVESLDVLRQKAFVNLAYVYLSMFEPQLAIAAASELLALPTCLKANKFLARSYAAEALSMLSRASEATEMLQSERDLLTMAEEYAQEAKIPVSRARAGVHVNNATTLILQGRNSEAEESVTRAVRENLNCRESLELLVYVLLKKGDTKKALRVLKEAQVTQ